MHFDKAWLYIDNTAIFAHGTSAGCSNTGYNASGKVMCNKIAVGITQAAGQTYSCLGVEILFGRTARGTDWFHVEVIKQRYLFRLLD